jgi:carbon storage regulator
MLVLTRKVNERIRVGEDITITVVRLGPGSVRIGIDAPAHLSIVREELTQSDSAAAWAGAEGDGEV